MIVSRCLEPLVKPDARPFEMTSLMKQYQYFTEYLSLQVTLNALPGHCLFEKEKSC